MSRETGPERKKRAARYIHNRTCGGKSITQRYNVWEKASCGLLVFAFLSYFVIDARMEKPDRFVMIVDLLKKLLGTYKARE